MLVKKLTESAIIPTRGSVGAAGFDLYADSIEGKFSTKTDENGDTVIIAAGGTNCIIHTGIAMAIPKGYVGLIFARSGLACKQGLRPANCVGVIDEDYRGEIIVNLYNDINFGKWYNRDSHVAHREFAEDIAEFKLHDRVAQIVFVKYEAFDMELTDNLDSTERGTGGFGSTGTN